MHRRAEVPGRSLGAGRRSRPARTAPARAASRHPPIRVTCPTSRTAPSVSGHRVLHLGSTALPPHRIAPPVDPCTSALPTLGYVQRLYDFLRRHPTGVDTFWAVLLFGFAWPVGRSRRPGGDRAPLAAARDRAALCLVVALRRRAPEKMLLLTVACGVAQLALDVKINPADFAMLVIIYTVAVAPTAPAGRPGWPSSAACRARRSRRCAGRGARPAASGRGLRSHGLR